MKKSHPLLCLLLAITLLLSGCDPTERSRKKEYRTLFEESEGRETATYQEVIAFYMELASDFPEINVQTFGKTDSGEPLHLVTYNPDGEFNYRNLGKDKAILLINNGIHPGESDGIDASMLLFRDLAKGVIPAPRHTVLACIPVYNVGGALNRNAFSRTNQNGPERYGFRGNARNYDLNRDFIKADTENTRSFHRLVRMVDPDFFVDTHVSNGANYQYTLTYLSTLQDRLSPELGFYLQQEFVPGLVEAVTLKGWDITPYVNVWGRPPDAGFQQFYDGPRYSTGFMGLWHTPGMMIETHMLKPYEQRVQGTYTMLNQVVIAVDRDYTKLQELRRSAREKDKALEYYAHEYQLDTASISRLNFKGYTAIRKRSEIGNFTLMAYDTTRPYNKEIAYYNRYRPVDSIRIPVAYAVPARWKGVVERLKANEIRLRPLTQDSTAVVEVYHVEDYDTSSSPYEGHYPHRNTRVSVSVDTVNLLKGDFLVPTRQKGMRYLLETLEPEAVDSFFNWNFFDITLQRKEGFSTYVFDSRAGELLRENDELREAFERAKEADSELAASYRAQLHWIYSHSPHSEESYLRYPIYRVNGSSGG